jgi:8-oxo-dGTP pyrophosphatase MutT (NUDIX family)
VASAKAADPKQAVVVVLREGDRVLVVRRGPAASRPGYWTPPSGRIEAGETQADTVAREAREELGLDVRPRAKVWECPTDDGRYRLHWWTADVVGGGLAPDPLEVAEVRWVTPDEFQRLAPVFDDDRRFFREVLPALERDARERPG